MLRPAMHEVVGLNWASPQAHGLVACFPLWANAGGPQIEMVRGQRSTNFNAAHLPRFDPLFGAVALGGGNNAGGGTTRAYQFPNQPYYNVGNFALAGRSWAYSFWFKTTRSTTIGNNEYLFQFSFNGGTFPGTAISFDTSDQLACNTNGDALSDAAFKSNMSPYDQKWHHCLFTQTPSGNRNTFDSTNTYYFDGVFDGSNGACVQADPAVDNLFFNGDDQGDAPSSQYLMDFRMYVGLKDVNFARHLFNPATRWDLYKVASVDAAVMTKFAEGRRFILGTH